MKLPAILPVAAVWLAVAAPVAAGSDARAVELAEATLQAMGGRESWEHTRYLKWRFFGRRLHHWDRATGDVRIESDTHLVLMNVLTKQGRVWEGGAEITDPAARADALDTAYAWWTNDSYWLLMPYKLLDPGVTLKYAGAGELEDGRAADRITVTFQDVGLTPENKYDVWIARDTGLVEQWAYFATAGDPEPSFTLPWSGWKAFGGIRLATGHGRDMEWEIEVPNHLPRPVFEEP